MGYNQDSIKKLFQEQLNKQDGPKPDNSENTAKSDSRVWVTLIAKSTLYIIRVVFTYLSYFLLHKNLGFDLHFSFLDFLLIFVGISSFIGICKNSLNI